MEEYFAKKNIDNKLYEISEDLIIDKLDNYRIIAKNNIKKNTVIIKDIPIYNLFGEKNINKTIQMIYVLLKNNKFDNNIIELYPRTNDIKIQNKNNNNIYNFNLIKCIKLFPDEKIKKYLLKHDIDVLYQYYYKYLFNVFDMSGSPVVLFTGSKINHSCDPNIYFIEEYSVMKFITLRNIKKGEEIFFSYLRNSKIDMNNKNERQKYLLNHYNFICKCSKW